MCLPEIHLYTYQNHLRRLEADLNMNKILHELRNHRSTFSLLTKVQHIHSPDPLF